MFTSSRFSLHQQSFIKRDDGRLRAYCSLPVNYRVHCRGAMLASLTVSLIVKVRGFDPALQIDLCVLIIILSCVVGC